MALTSGMWQPGHSSLACVELFAGVQSVTNGFIHRGFKAEGFDKASIDPRQDLTTTEGFMRAFEKVLRLMPDGLLFAAPPCSLFVFMSAYVHQRSRDNPLGNQNVQCVKESNLVFSRTVYLILLAMLVQLG